jgi:hypothetical protein
MALTERLMGLNDDGTEPGDDPNKIPVHAFFAALNEIVAGALTVAQVKALFAMRNTVDASGRSDMGELDSLAATLPAASNPAARALFLERVHGVYMLAEGRFTGYNTPAAVRAKLGI